MEHSAIEINDDGLSMKFLRFKIHDISRNSCIQVNEF